MIKFVYGTIIFATLVGVLSRCGGDAPGSAALNSAPVIAAAAPTTASKTVGNGYAETTLERSSDGHFYAEMRVNGTPITFMVDTGASVIALSREDAARLGISTLESDFTGVAQTASGTVGLKPVTLDRVSLGPLEASQVDAAVVQQGLDTSLLGQSWLRQVGTVRIEGDRMIFR